MMSFWDAVSLPQGPLKSVSVNVTIAVVGPATALGDFCTLISFSPEPQVSHLHQGDISGPFLLASL